LENRGNRKRRNKRKSRSTRKSFNFSACSAISARFAFFVSLLDNVALLFEIEQFRRDRIDGRFSQQSQRRVFAVVAHPHGHFSLARNQAARAEELRFEPDSLDLPAIGLEALALADEHFKLVVLFVGANRKGDHLSLVHLLQPHEVDGRNQAEHPVLALQRFGIGARRRVGFGQIGGQIFDLLFGAVEEGGLYGVFFSLLHLLEADPRRKIAQVNQRLQAVANVNAEDPEERAFRDRSPAQAQNLFVGGGRELDVQPIDQRLSLLLLRRLVNELLPDSDFSQVLERHDADRGVNGEAR